MDIQYIAGSCIPVANKYLSAGALVPVVGTVTGSVKILLGLIQAVGAILGGVYSLATSDTHRQRYAKQHFIYAIESMGIGLLEAIPLLGSIVAATQVFQCWSCALSAECRRLGGALPSEFEIEH